MTETVDKVLSCRKFTMQVNVLSMTIIPLFGTGELFFICLWVVAVSTNATLCWTVAMLQEWIL